MTALDTLLAGLIDYAGLYPPAALDMGAAVRNYIAYRADRHAALLGRFILDVARLEEFRANAGAQWSDLPLSVIVASEDDARILASALDRGFRIQSAEVKPAPPERMRAIANALPVNFETYFEVPWALTSPPELDAIASVGGRAKLRTGGIVPQAIPASDRVVAMLQELARRRIAFKATAGLHHPLRSSHRLTCAADGVVAIMHGFVNLFHAAALVYLDSHASEARAALEEQDPHTFRLSESGLEWRGRALSIEQVRAVRQQFFLSFGSCSFTEPVIDLEALGWLS